MGTDAGVPRPGISDPPNAEYNLATRDHQRIRRWVDERGGYPTTAESTGRSTDLRLAFADSADVTRLDWDEFFDRFDEADLAMAYRVSADGERRRPSRRTATQ